MERLKEKLKQIDGRGYKAYKTIEGEYKFPDFTLLIDHVQGDPFASPSRLRVRLSQQRAGFPAELFENESRRTALEDYLVRSFADAIRRYVRGGRGTGRSGLVAIAPCGQEILKRSAVVVGEDYVE
ncbi:MAG TPA: ATPase, partial [Firmicutes bacterium]|nr:ATPase [Bacillota bacterium]